MANEFSTGKSVFILAIVAGCFAVLWPNIFYPMLMGSYSEKNVAYSEGCCDVMFDSDVNAIKIMTQLCKKILSSMDDFDKKFLFAFQQGKLTKEIVETCQHTVIDKCGVDITEFLREKVALGKTYKQMLDGIRDLNNSLCLKQNFDVSLGQIGLPHRVRLWGVNISKHLRQERPPHLRPELLHPALREKGRAIPQSHVVPKAIIQDGRPGPLPGLRPPMGGAGHVVPPPKGSGTMGIVMPMYTLGIVVFFLYTMMKLMFKKSEDSVTCDGFTSDPEFRRAVFDTSSHRFPNNKESSDESTKLGDLELDLLKKRLQETEKAMERIVAQMMSLPHNSLPPENSEAESTSEEIGLETDRKENEKCISEIMDSHSQPEDKKEILSEESVESELENGKSAVKVVGMEMTESCEGGAKWSRPPTPLSRPLTPQNIYLPGSLPSQSQLLVSDSHTETLSEQDNAVVLTGKVTLSLIGLMESGTKEDDKTTFQKEESTPEEGVHHQSVTQVIDDKSNDSVAGIDSTSVEKEVN